MRDDDEDNEVYDQRSLSERLALAAKAMPPLDFLRSIYADESRTVPLEMKISAARAALPYEHRKLPTSLQISDTRNAPLFNVNDLRKLNNEELRSFIALSDKLGIDFGGRQGRVIDAENDKTGLNLLESITKPTLTPVKEGHLVKKSSNIVTKAAKTLTKVSKKTEKV